MTDRESTVQARMSVANIIVDYMHNEGSQVARSTHDHAVAIAERLGTEGFLIHPSFDVAVDVVRYQSLEADQQLLGALQATGVDNWEGYGDALRKLRSDAD